MASGSPWSDAGASPASAAIRRFIDTLPSRLAHAEQDPSDRRDLPLAGTSPLGCSTIGFAPPGKRSDVEAVNARTAGPRNEGGLSTISSTKLSTRNGRSNRGVLAERLRLQEGRRVNPRPGEADSRQRQSGPSSRPADGSAVGSRLPSRSAQSASDHTAADAAIPTDVSSMQPRN